MKHFKSLIFCVGILATQAGISADSHSNAKKCEGKEQQTFHAYLLSLAEGNPELLKELQEQQRLYEQRVAQMNKAHDLENKKKKKELNQSLKAHQRKQKRLERKMKEALEEGKRKMDQVVADYRRSLEAARNEGVVYFDTFEEMFEAFQNLSPEDMANGVNYKVR